MTGEMKGKGKPVTLEPDLEGLYGHLPVGERLVAAARHFRWAKQLYKSCDILRARAQIAPEERKRLKWVPDHKLTES